jgi:hypothetical protein
MLRRALSYEYLRAQPVTGQSKDIRPGKGELKTMFTYATRLFAVTLSIGLLGIAIASADAQTPTQVVAGEAAKAGVKAVTEIIAKNVSGDACTRHIYNKTKSDWVFKGGPGSGMCEEGCLIKARKSASEPTAIPIHYTGNTMGIDVMGPNGRHDGFTVKGKGNCVYIEHNGKTDPVFLNDPANGDIIFDMFEK